MAKKDLGVDFGRRLWGDVQQNGHVQVAASAHKAVNTGTGLQRATTETDDTGNSEERGNVGVAVGLCAEVLSILCVKWLVCHIGTTIFFFLTSSLLNVNCNYVSNCQWLLPIFVGCARFGAFQGVLWQQGFHTKSLLNCEQGYQEVGN
jgi:hypothetical protein